MCGRLMAEYIICINIKKQWILQESVSMLGLTHRVFPFTIAIKGGERKIRWFGICRRFQSMPKGEIVGIDFNLMKS